jgi:hypothetical protein
MAPTPTSIPRTVFVDYAKRAVVAAGPEIARLSAHNLVLRRKLGVNHTQGITLGIIVVYVIVIALLWNIPYVRYSLWPFKVHLPHHPFPLMRLTPFADARNRLPRIRPRHNSLLHRWPREIHLPRPARRRGNTHGWRNQRHHTTCWIPWLVAHRRSAHILRI